MNRFYPSLAFPVFILSNIKYIGLIYLIFSDKQKNKSMILAVAFALTFFSSLQAAMFHDILLWSAFIGMYAAYIFRPSNKGNTTNFIYNVPNKVFEYLVCGLNVCYPAVMIGMKAFSKGRTANLQELNFDALDKLSPSDLFPVGGGTFNRFAFTAEQALTPLFNQLGMDSVPQKT